VGGTFNGIGKRRTGTDNILVRHHIIHGHRTILFHPVGTKPCQGSTKDERKLTYQGNPSSSSGNVGSAALPLPFSEVENRGRLASTISTSSSDAIASRQLSMQRNCQREARVGDASVAEPDNAVPEFELYSSDRQNFAQVVLITHQSTLSSTIPSFISLDR